MIKLHKSKYWYIIHKKITTVFPFSLYLKPKREKEVPENNIGLIARNITKKGSGFCKEYWKEALTNLCTLFWKCLHKATFLFKNVHSTSEGGPAFWMGFQHRDLHQIDWGLGHPCRDHSLVLKNFPDLFLVLHLNLLPGPLSSYFVTNLVQFHTIPWTWGMAFPLTGICCNSNFHCFTSLWIFFPRSSISWWMAFLQGSSFSFEQSLHTRGQKEHVYSKLQSTKEKCAEACQ